MTPVGSLSVGYLGSALGPRQSVVICGAITMLCGLTLMTRLKMVGAAQAPAIAD